MTTLQKIKLGNALEELIDYRGKTPNKKSFGIPLVTAKIVKGGFIDEPREFIAESDYKSWMTRGFPKIGDVVLTTEAPLGEVAQIKNPNVALAQRIIVLRGKKDILNSSYLKFYFQSPIGQSKLKERGSGTTVVGIKQSELRKIEIEVPNFTAQTRIASVLSAYDNLMENNEKRLKILEEITQFLYIEQFIKTKSKLGFTSLETLITIKKGKNITSNTVTNGEIPVVAGGLNPAYYHNKANTLAPVITISASGANAGFVNIYYENIWASDCSFIDRNITAYPYFYYLFLKNNQNIITKSQRGSAQPHVYPADLMRLQIANIPEKIVQKFENKIEPFFNEISVLKKENNNLKKTLSILIPQLIIGNKILKEEKIKTSVKKEVFKDAIVFSYYIKKVCTSNFYPTHLRAVKSIYFTDRFVGIDPTQKYTEQRFGPYNPQSTYAGGEKIALGKKYVKRVTGGFKPGEKMHETEKYTYQELRAVDKMLSFFKSKKDDDLELLATVDFVMYKKLQSGEKPTADFIFNYIRSSKVWKEKMNRLQLSAEKIKNAMNILNELKKSGLTYPNVNS